MPERAQLAPLHSAAPTPQLHPTLRLSPSKCFSRVCCVFSSRLNGSSKYPYIIIIIQTHLQAPLLDTFERINGNGRNRPIQTSPNDESEEPERFRMLLNCYNATMSAICCCAHSQGCLHQSPSTLGKAPSCPPACSPSFPGPRSASLYLYGGPGWPARSTLHLAVKRRETEREKGINTKNYSKLLFFPSTILSRVPCHRIKSFLFLTSVATHLPVGVQVSSRYLQSNQILSLLVKLLREEAGLLCQQVCPNNLLLQPTQTTRHHRFSKPRLCK